MRGGLFSYFLVLLSVAAAFAADEDHNQHNHASAHSAALMGFESYVNQLLEKVVTHNLTLTDEELSAIETIKAFIDSMYDDLFPQWQTDIAYTQDCVKEFEFCDADNDQRYSLVVGEENLTIGARNEHTACRNSEAGFNDSCAVICAAYYDYRVQTVNGFRPAEFPACAAGTPRFDVSQGDNPEEDPLLSTEACLEELDVWMNGQEVDGVSQPGLWDKYVPCRDCRLNLEPIEIDCGQKQTHFEDLYCSWAIDYVEECSLYRTCYERSELTCGDVCATVAISEAARKADNETGIRVKCLLDVFLLPNDQKEAALQACLELVVDTTPWDVPCPPQPLPALPECGAPVNVPCEQEFLTQEYTGEPWYPNVEMAPCSQCENLTSRTVNFTGCFADASSFFLQAGHGQSTLIGNSFQKSFREALLNSDSLFAVASFGNLDETGLFYSFSHLKEEDALPGVDESGCGTQCFLNHPRYCGCARTGGNDGSVNNFACESTRWAVYRIVD